MIPYFILIKTFGVSMKKPFNPILGETYQARAGSLKIAFEQISHHPPISAFNCWNKHDDRYWMHGYYELKATFGGNSSIGHGDGPFTI